MKDDKLYLIHISECIERIEQYLPERSKKYFCLLLSFRMPF